MQNAMLLVLVLALAGCADSAAPSAHDTPAGDPPATDAAFADREAPVEQTPADSAEANTPAGARLALEGEGLRAFSVPSGASRQISFGTDKAAALDMLEAVRGSPPSEQGENIDCGATNAIWPDGLVVFFARNQFVGWSLGSQDATLTTAGGLGLGSTRAEVENGATVARIFPSTLGTEFTAGNVAGLLASDAADARVTHLWAGQTCIAR